MSILNSENCIPRRQRLLGQTTTKQSLSNFELRKRWKYRELSGMRPDPISLWKNKCVPRNTKNLFFFLGFCLWNVFRWLFTIQPECHVLPGLPVIFTSCHLEHQLEYLLFGNKKYWHFSVSLLSTVHCLPKS